MIIVSSVAKRQLKLREDHELDNEKLGKKGQKLRAFINVTGKLENCVTV